MQYFFLIIFVLLVAVELLYFRIADRLNIIDKPNERSSHKTIVLRGGGIIFVFGAWFGALFFGLQYPWFLAGLTIIAMISFWDDVRSLPDSVRLVVQFLAMFLMFHQLGILQWSLWWVVLIGCIVSVGITNAYNFMDGINGMTGGYSLAVLIPLMIVNGFDGLCPSCSMGSGVSFISPHLLVAIFLSVLVFCFFNFRKRATCFAGDVGAISMAFILVFAIGLLMIKTQDYSYIMFLAVYGVDTVLTIIHRILLHENLGEAHRKHVYQLMANELKKPHILVSSIYMIIQILISAGLIWIPMNHYLYSVIVLVVLCTAYFLFKKKYYHLHEEYLASIHSSNTKTE